MSRSSPPMLRIAMAKTSRGREGLVGSSTPGCGGSATATEAQPTTPTGGGRRGEREGRERRQLRAVGRGADSSGGRRLRAEECGGLGVQEQCQSNTLEPRIPRPLFVFALLAAG